DARLGFGSRASGGAVRALGERRKLAVEVAGADPRTRTLDDRPQLLVVLSERIELAVDLGQPLGAHRDAQHTRSPHRARTGSRPTKNEGPGVMPSPSPTGRPVSPRLRCDVSW